MSDSLRNEIQLTLDKYYEKRTNKTKGENQDNSKEAPQNYNY